VRNECRDHFSDINIIKRQIVKSPFKSRSWLFIARMYIQEK
jgi:hypothetical protein